MRLKIAHPSIGRVDRTLPHPPGNGRRNTATVAGQPVAPLRRAVRLIHYRARRQSRRNTRRNNQTVIPTCFYRESSLAPRSLGSALRGNGDHGAALDGD